MTPILVVVLIQVENGSQTVCQSFPVCRPIEQSAHSRGKLLDIIDKTQRMLKLVS